MTRIMMSGVTSEEDVAAANQVLPDYAGFVFWPESHCYITPEQAVPLGAALDEDITVAGVFVDAPARFVAALLNEDLIEIAVLHGAEDAAYIDELRRALRAPDEKALVKAFPIKTASDIQAAHASNADMVLLNAGLNDDASSGPAFDWSLVAELDRPYFLGGGLTAGNVTDALDQTGAAYLDVCRGIETDGRKDPAKMRAFADAVRTWDREHPRLSFLESLHPEYHGSSAGE